MAKKKVKKVVVKKKEQEELFVGIKDPVEVRRNVLESLKEIVTLMQKQETERQVREEKLETLNKMRKNLREINSLIGKLKGELPLLPAQPKPKPVTVQKAIPQVKEPEVKPSKIGPEIDKLEKELADIEAKLSKL